MSDFVERMKAEEAQLAERTTKLSAFIGTPTFLALPDVERLLLQEQYYAMQTYHRLLAKRINFHSS